MTPITSKKEWLIGEMWAKPTSTLESEAGYYEVKGPCPYCPADHLFTLPSGDRVSIENLPCRDGERILVTVPGERSPLEQALLDPVGHELTMSHEGECKTRQGELCTCTPIWSVSK